MIRCEWRGYERPVEMRHIEGGKGGTRGERGAQ
jgi:hypothetical protein